MTQDAPYDQHGPRVNGASEPASVPAPGTPPPLALVCGELRRKVTAFLKEEPKDKVLRAVQDQVRVSLGVIEEAMRRYR